VRGLAADAMPRDERWHAMRLGTFLPRAGWMSALLMACADVARAEPATADAVWRAAALVAGDDGVPGTGPVLVTLLADGDHPVSVAHAMDQVTGALFALSRGGGTDAGPLALARATVARLSAAWPRDPVASTGTEVIGEVLDAIGAIAGSVKLRAGARPPVAA
ncbi:MAG: alpha-E domain-containing protein, partial [Actinobacteria bacterium]|nr:alpha-E domain-containing protein [Actinomycetota bacterium]